MRRGRRSHYNASVCCAVCRPMARTGVRHFFSLLSRCLTTFCRAYFALAVARSVSICSNCRNACHRRCGLSILTLPITVHRFILPYRLIHGATRICDHTYRTIKNSPIRGVCTHVMRVTSPKSPCVYYSNKRSASFVPRSDNG